MADPGILKYIIHHTSEIPVLLPVLHSRLRQAVVEAGGASFADLGREDVLDNILHGLGAALHGGGAGSVAYGAEADVADRGHIAGIEPDMRGDGEQLAARRNHTVAGMREIDIREFDVFAADIVPHIQFGP